MGGLKNAFDFDAQIPEGIDYERYKELTTVNVVN